MSETLQLAEAIPLGYAVLSRVATDAGVRMLGIKGPVLALQGLREPRTSVDIDVLVEPDGLEALTEGLERIGWGRLGVSWTPGLVPKHSVNHRHPHWPCDVDVHHWFPGFLASPAEVFDILWRSHVRVEVAHVEIAAPGLVGNAAIAALHYLRDEGHGNRRADLDALVDRVAAWPPARLRELSVLAADTGAADTLRPFLDEVSAPQCEPTRPLTVSLDSWNLQSKTESVQVLPWLIALQRSPLRGRPRLLWKAMWPDAQRFTPHGADELTKGRALLRARWVRLRQGIGAFRVAREEAQRAERDPHD